MRTIAATPDKALPEIFAPDRRVWWQMTAAMIRAMVGSSQFELPVPRMTAPVTATPAAAVVARIASGDVG
ncbi:hypothetical protein OG558_27035 [Kribbella sp. NBC_01510]|uniref:hypothetical protein n=1 Tax=Kribbella sp. NBC_01510 TaxID=2903581 RepID=UPI00386669B2